MTTPWRQPFLHDLTITLCAPTMVVSGPDGDLDAGAPGAGVHGMFHADVRVVSLMTLALRELDAPEHPDPRSPAGWSRPEPLTAFGEGPGRTRFIGLARSVGDDVPDPTVRVERSRTVTPGGLSERIAVQSSASRTVRLALEVRIAGDFLGLEHVKAGLPVAPVAPARVGQRPAGWPEDEAAHGATGALPGVPPGAVLQWERDALTVGVRAPGATLDARAGTVRWELRVRPGTRSEVGFTVTVSDDGAVVTGVGGAGAGRGAPWARPTVTAHDGRVQALLDQSLDDLQSLQLADPDRPDDVFLAAGAPWFLTLFGRDSLWAARFLLPLGTRLALGTLRTLAARQGTRHDPRTEEEPGKILHELRRGTFDDGAGLRLPPVYYGTVDATALWVCLLHDAWRWGMRPEDVEPLLPTMVAALEWLSRAASATGNGFLSYLDHTGVGLTNQGWKDSADSVRFGDGRLATGPVALAEVQGYAHEAALGGAALLDAFGSSEGDRWRSFAAALEARFRDRFWVSDARGDYPAMALDGAGRPVDSVTSNIGHLLTSGLLDAAETAAVAARLAAPDMADGYGLRTMSSGAPAYAPLSYHCGSVWPHDTMIAIQGLARTGHRAAANALAEGLVAAASSFGNRLPELWGGDPRAAVRVPVPYPAACRPQAWSAASAVALVPALFALQPDVPAGRLRLASQAGPAPFGALSVTGLRISGQPLDLLMNACGDVSVVRAPAAVTVRVDEPAADGAGPGAGSTPDATQHLH